MAVLRAVISDKDGIIHELVLRKRAKNAGYSWFYGDSPLIVTPARDPDEAVTILKRELAPTPDEKIQLISIARLDDE